MCILDRFIHHILGIYFGNLRLEEGQLVHDADLISSRHIKPVESADLNDWLRVRGKEWGVMDDPWVLSLDNWQMVVVVTKIYKT